MTWSLWGNQLDGFSRVNLGAADSGSNGWVGGGREGRKGIRVVSTDADDFAAIGCNASSGHSDSIDIDLPMPPMHVREEGLGGWVGGDLISNHPSPES